MTFKQIDDASVIAKIAAALASTFAPSHEPTFTGGATVSSTTPTVDLIDTNGGTDQSRFRIITNGQTGDTYLVSLNDDGSTRATALVIDHDTGALADPDFVGTIDLESTSFPTLTIKDTDQGDNQRYQIYIGGGGLTFAGANDTDGSRVALNLDASNRLDTRSADRFRVPEIVGAEDAAQVTAYDATTGRLAIGGHEIGDTDNVTLTSWNAAGVVSGWVLGSDFTPRPGSAGHIRIRRRAGRVLVSISNLTAVTGGLRSLWDLADDRANDLAGFLPTTTVGGLNTGEIPLQMRQDSSVRVFRTYGGDAYVNLPASEIVSIGHIEWDCFAAWPTALPVTGA